MPFYTPARRASMPRIHIASPPPEIGEEKQMTGAIWFGMLPLTHVRGAMSIGMEAILAIEGEKIRGLK